MVNTALNVNLHNIIRNSYYLAAGHCELCLSVNSSNDVTHLAGGAQQLDSALRYSFNATLLE